MKTSNPQSNFSAFCLVVSERSPSIKLQRQHRSLLDFDDVVFLSINGEFHGRWT